ncbi:MAG: tetratricopeptide repeat protein [Flammeovirgaceae bacterium]|nr:MAG: tetratricopeptide repeat protein [Flammeovirgaceae bacterium]
MKKAIVLLVVALPMVVMAQKPIKPNLNKALSLWQSGKLDEAKQMIDVCETDPKLSLDPKTWFYSGLIYSSLDTTQNENYKALAPNAFEKALASLAKADELNKNSKNELFYTDKNSFVPVTRSMITDRMSGHYLNQGAAAYQEDDFKTALFNFDRAQKVKPDDTTSYFYAGIVANADEQYDRASNYMKTYLKNGGTAVEAYYVMINAASLTDKAKAIEIAREAKTKYPKNVELPKMEIQYLIELDRVQEAKAGLEVALKSEPNNVVLHYFLAYTNFKMGNYEAAKTSCENALKIDPNSFDAQLLLAKAYFVDAEVIKKQMSSLGITEADKKKRFELDKVYVEKLKVALPYWEKAEKLNPNDSEVLDALYLIYGDLDNQAGIKRIEKRYKELGLDN